MASALLERCLNGEPWSTEMVAPLASEACSEMLIRVVAEGLADRFEPRLCDEYAAIFSQAMAGDDSLVARYQRVRRIRRCQTNPRRIFVLSRVTLGADIAVTSVLMDAAKRRFPKAEVVFAGPAKNAELFSKDAHLRMEYPRGSLRDRLAIPRLDESDSIVIDPDSRITQLGLIPICEEENYFFFESRSYGAETEHSLPLLAGRWAAEVFGVTDAKPYIRPAPVTERATVAISLGIGGNAAKRLPDWFERELIAGIEADIYIDAGAGGEEAARVESAVAGRANVRTWRGSFASFASIIANSDVYAGYDSAGQHAAAACGTPLVSIFAGHPCPRFFHRWRPSGSVILVKDQEPAAILDLALEKIHDYLQDRQRSEHR